MVITFKVFGNYTVYIIPKHLPKPLPLNSSLIYQTGIYRTMCIHTANTYFGALHTVNLLTLRSPKRTFFIKFQWLLLL